MRFLTIFVILIVVLSAQFANASFISKSKMKPENSEQTDFPKYFIEQRVNHFNRQDLRTFQQKYYINDLYWNKPTGPVFLAIQGEGPVSSPPTSGGIVELAQQFGALIVAPEHRYYGDSRVLWPLTVENMVYLHTEQALADLANFTMFIQKQYIDPVRKDASFSSSKKTLANDWWVFGCSYSGALAAYYRTKYPHLSKGALASSGVVNSILEFTAFDEQVSTSVGPYWAMVLRQVTFEIEYMLFKNAQTNLAVKSLFDSQTLEDGDFMMMLADSTAIAVQYGLQSLLEPVVAAYEAKQDIVAVYANYTKTWFYPLMNGGGSSDYDRKFLANSTPEHTASRNWQWQTCSEMAYWQIAPKKNSIRSKLLNLDYFRGLCSFVFGPKVWPDTNKTNLLYGGALVQGNRIIYMQGSQDPWQHAGYQGNFINEPSRIIVCPDCGHCADVRGCPSLPNYFNYTSCDDPQGNVASARSEIFGYMLEWLK